MVRWQRGGNAVDKRGLCETTKRQDLKYGFEVTEKQQMNPTCRESRKRQGAHAYLIAGKAKPRQSRSRGAVPTALLLKGPTTPFLYEPRNTRK